MNKTDAGSSNIPAHVPSHLIRQWDALSGVGADFETLPFEAIDAVRETAPPIFYSPIPGYKREGAWYVTRQEDIRSVLTRPAIFSSVDIVGFSALIGESFPMLPVEVDPPQHTRYRALLAKLFDPRSVQKMADTVRNLAVTTIESFRTSGHCEFGTQFSQPFPILISLGLLGLPSDRLAEFKGWVDQVLHGATMADKAEGARGIHRYFREVIADRKQNPGTDIISSLTQAEIEGRKLSDDELIGLTWLLFSGGLDTVVSALGFHFHHLATHPELQGELRAEPEKIPGAVEEMMRAFSMVSTPRRVVHDIELGGVQMLAGDWIVVTTAFGGRDADANENPHEIDISRSPCRHVAFGGGPHMCIGMHLARLEMKIAIEEWLARVPEFTLDRSQSLRVHGGGVFGVDEMHLRWRV